MFCVAYLAKKRQPGTQQYPAIVGIGAEVRGRFLFVERLHTTVATKRKRKVVFHLRAGGVVQQSVTVILPALNECDNLSFFPDIKLEVLGNGANT